MEHFSSHPGGEIYGLRSVPGSHKLKWLQAKSPIPGLYLTGADVAGSGVTGALMGGVMTVAKIKGMAVYPKVFGRR